MMGQDLWITMMGVMYSTSQKDYELFTFNSTNWFNMETTKEKLHYNRKITGLAKKLNNTITTRIHSLHNPIRVSMKG